jgi:hypothetical protein
MKSFVGGSFDKDLQKIRNLSSLVRKKLESNPNYERKIQKLTPEELEDFDKLLGLAEQILLKYRHKKEAYCLLKEFADLVKDWTMSLSEINDEIQVMLICAQSSVSEIKNAQTDVSSNLSIDKPKSQGTINLTNSTTGVHTQEYQQNSKIQSEQVI